MKNNNPYNTAIHKHLPSQSPPPNPANLKQLFSDVVSLKFLQFLQIEMQPHYQSFNLVEVALLIDKYICGYLLKPEPEGEQRQVAVLGSVALPLGPKLVRNLSQRGESASAFQVRQEQAFEMLVQQLKAIFLYYSAHALSYEMINEYVYNQQLNCLSNGEVDEDYIEIGEKRARLDQNVKLCIMPLSEQGVEVKTSKIRQLVFRQNKRGAELESVFTVTTDYVRCIRIKPELIGIASDFSRKGEADCWYHYEPELIRPKRSTLSVIGKTEEGVAISSAELKEMRASSATNMEEKFSEQLLSLLKASVSENLLGMISLDQSFVVEPLSKGKGRVTQGYIGNLVRDVPLELGSQGGCKEKYQQILLFESYSDTEWLILTDKFLYFYRVPLPVENIVLTEQNNLHRAIAHRPNPLLLLCQRLPRGCVKAVTLRRPFVALMLQSNSVVIVKLIVNCLGVFEGRQLRPQLNYYKITNKIYNDIQFRTICFHRAFNNIFLSDFGAYLIRVAFNPTYGDVEEEGITHDRQESSQLNHQMIRNSYSELKATRSQAQRRTVVEAAEQDQQEQGRNQFIQVHYLKPTRGQEGHLFSIYKKQNSSPHTMIIKNQTRQVITALATNHNFNTLVTYESESYEKKTGSEWEGERYREWGNRNKIKLWDVHHMTIYKTYDVALELSFLELRANGLFALTADRGYLVFYPFNEDRKAIMSEAEQRVLDQNSREVAQELDEVTLHGNSLYFSTLTSAYNKYSGLKVHRTHIYELQLQKYPNVRLLQALPSEISALAVNSRVYVLENATQGVEASQLHVYNRLGLKQEVVVFSNPESVSAEGKINQENYSQEYKFLKRIDHQQFQVVVWNTDSLKMLGNSPEESYTVVFSSARLNHLTDGVERVRSIKDIAVLGPVMLVYCETTTRIREKAALTQTASRVSGSTERRSHPHERVSKSHEQTEFSIILINNKLDRITYRLERISPRVKVLHMYNELVLTREEAGEYDCVRVLDVGEHGQLEKLLFTSRFRRSTTERVRLGEFRGSDFYEVAEDRNVVLQELREYSVRKLITLQDTRIAVTRSNKLVVVLVFKVETHYSDLVTRRQVRSEVEFMVYGRNISEELLNANYKISKIQVGKKTEKHLYQYQTSSTRTESIFGHKVLSLDDCLAISNYTEIDMQKLCDAIDSDPTRAQSVDITDKILSPKNINNNHVRDIYEILSLKHDKLLYERFLKEPNQVNAINAFSFKIVEFSDEDLTGTIAISNKLMRTVGVYTFEIDCQRREPPRGQPEVEVELQQPYELRMALQKVALVEVKSHREIQLEEQSKRAEPGAGRQEIQHVRLLEWSEGYKSSVEEMWDGTLTSIKQFIRSERVREVQGKRSISLPPIAIHRMDTLLVKKKEMLKKKLSASERLAQPPPVKPLEGEGASLMFKKWTISQAIHLEKEGRDANNNAEMRNVNKYVNKVLRSEEDTAERVQELIKNTRRIKEASQKQESRVSSPGSDPRRQKAKTEVEITNRSVVVSHLDNVLRSSEVAKESNIRTYLQQRQRVPTQDTKQDYYKFSRNDTNQSGLTLAITDKTALPADVRPSNNLSKLSNHTNATRKTRGNVALEVSGSLEVKLKLKLQEIQERSLSNPKADLKFYTPDRMKTNPDSSFHVGQLRTDKSRYNLTSSPEERQRIIRLTTEPTETLKNKVHSQISFTLTPSQEIMPSPPKKSTQEKRFDDYKNNFSLLGYKQRAEEEAEQAKGTGVGMGSKKQSAVERLKRSQEVMNSVYLPEIASTKEKLMKKMKEKRSYVKTIQAHLNDSSLLALREGEKRKQLIRKLYDYT